MKKFIALLAILALVFTLAGTVPAKADPVQGNETLTNYKVVGYPDIQIYKSNVKIYIEGKLVDFEKMYNRPVINIKGRIMLPARAFVYYINNVPPGTDDKFSAHFWANKPFATDWDRARRTDGRKGANWIMLVHKVPNTNKEIHVNLLEGYQYVTEYFKEANNPYSGRDDYKTFKMDIPPLITDIAGGTTYLPLRMQAYLFGFGVKFDEANNAVYISKDIPMEFGDGIEEIKNEPQYQDEWIGEYGIFYPSYGYLYQNGKLTEIYPWDGK